MKSKPEKTLVVEKCGHRLPYGEFCSFCEQNRLDISENLRVLLEQQDSNNSTLVVADMCSTSSMWSYDQSMEILAEMLPRSTLGTMFILPFRQLHGWDAFFASYCFSLGLQSSTYLVIRNLFEHLFVENNSSGSTAGIKTAEAGIEDIAEKIAADILPNFVFEDRKLQGDSHRISWPYSVCSYGDRVIDMRSSLLYKLQMLRKKKPSRDHLHPLKVVASSLHHLNLFYQDICASNEQMINFYQQDRYLIDFQDLIYDRKFGAISCDIIPGLRKYGSHDMAKLFGHATPGLTWNLLDDIFPPIAEAAEEIGNRNVTQSAARRSKTSGNPPITGKMSISSDAGVAFNDGNTNAPEHLESLGSISFQSPFGEMELLRTSQYSKQMLRQGGYRHLFDANFDANTVNDSLSIIDMYLDH
jgi:hypothetical protein